MAKTQIIQVLMTLKKSVVKKVVEITDVTMNDDGDDVNKVHDKI